MAPLRVGELPPATIVRLEEDGPTVVLLDQRRLPDDVVEVRCSSPAEVAEAIGTMVVRGAPAIGIAAAYGMALASLRGEDLLEAERVLGASRPTAVNLPWALARMRDEPTPERARALHEEEVERCRRMAAHAVERLRLGRRSAPRRRRARPARARPRRRDAAAAPGCAAHRLGARAGGHPARGDRGFGSRVDDG